MFIVFGRLVNWPVCGYSCLRLGSNVETAEGVGLWASETDWYNKSYETGLYGSIGT
jgi:hypothetical protein